MTSGQSPGRLPNLVIAGVTKAGTTSLFHYLGQHPDICTSDTKELRYFSPLQYGEPLPPLESYSAHFRHCQQQEYAVEGTPGYFYGGAPLARGLHAALPDARVLLILRSPDDRCWSFFRFVKSKVRIPKSMTFAEYLDRCEELQRSGTDMEKTNGDFSGLVKGCYARWLDAWTDEFGEGLRILLFDDVVTDPAKCLRQIFNWLELDDTVVDSMDFGADNTTVEYRRQGLQRMAVSFNRHAQRYFERHRRLKDRLRAGYYMVNRAPASETLGPAEKDRMQRFYAPHNAELAKQLSARGLVLPANWAMTSDAADKALSD